MATIPPSNPISTTKAGAERDAAQQDGFLREVDEALREEQMVDALRRYAKPVGGAIAAGLLALGGYLYWDHTVKAEAGTRSERSALAFDKLQTGQLDAAGKEFAALGKDGSAASRTAAALTAAAIMLEQGKLDEAAKQFAAIAADPKAPKPYRDLAALREVTARYDTLKPDDVIARLRPIAVPGNAFFGSAGELLGMAYLDAGKSDLAGALFAQIGQDKTVPQSIRGRVRQVASGLGYDGGIELPDAPVPAAGAPAAAAPAPANAPAGAAPTPPKPQ